MKAAMLKQASLTGHAEIVARNPRWTSTVERDAAEDCACLLAREACE